MSYAPPGASSAPGSVLRRHAAPQPRRYKLLFLQACRSDAARSYALAWGNMGAGLRNASSVKQLDVSQPRLS